MVKVINGKPSETRENVRRMGLLAPSWLTWKIPQVIVQDRFTSPSWSDWARFQVDALNAHMPEGAPQFVYEKADGVCVWPPDDPTWTGDTPDGVITLCTFPEDGVVSGYGANRNTDDGTAIEAGRVWVNDGSADWYMKGVLCHELIHTLWNPVGGSDEHLDMVGTCANDSSYGDVDAKLFAELYGGVVATTSTTTSTTQPPTPTTRPPKPPKPGHGRNHTSGDRRRGR